MIAKRLHELRDRISKAEMQYGRIPGSVALLAVSKGQTVSAIREAVLAGQHALGENYLQEALEKIHAVADQSIEWHFIGSIQKNKTKLIAAHFSWAHSISCLEIAERLSRQRPGHLPPLNVCIQVNVDRQSSKSGVDSEGLASLALAVSALPHIKLRGLMTIPAPTPDFEQQRVPFKQVRLAFEQLCSMGLPLDTLSMGMSADFEAAIAEGATLLRIGTALFGPR